MIYQKLLRFYVVQDGVFSFIFQFLFFFSAINWQLLHQFSDFKENQSFSSFIVLLSCRIPCLLAASVLFSFTSINFSSKISASRFGVNESIAMYSSTISASLVAAVPWVVRSAKHSHRHSQTWMCKRPTNVLYAQNCIDYPMRFGENLCNLANVNLRQDFEKRSRHLEQQYS